MFKKDIDVTRMSKSVLKATNSMNCVYGKCSKISNTLNLRTPKIIAENIFQNILKNRTLTFFGKVNF